MTATPIERWLKSGRPAQIAGLLLRPIEHSILDGTPVAMQRGQANAYPLTGSDGGGWILKKFHLGRAPDCGYLESVTGLLPRHNGLRCGTERRILTADQLSRAGGCYHTREFSRWLDRTVLMPRVTGMDWASVADEIRDGKVRLDREQRLTLCRRLGVLVGLQEAAGCVHRDLSSGNVFVDPVSLEVSLIDFDSAFHPSLSMPTATTGGTEGYIAPFVWSGDNVQPRSSWCAHADRFALALLTSEFLVMDRGTPLTGEGGVFDQDQLRVRKGSTLRYAVDRLTAEFPVAARLLDSAINAESYVQCPVPDDWISFCDGAGRPAVDAPALYTIEAITVGDFASILSRRGPAAPVWQAPRLSDLPAGLGKQPLNTLTSEALSAHSSNGGPTFHKPLAARSSAKARRGAGTESSTAPTAQPASPGIGSPIRMNHPVLRLLQSLRSRT